MRKDEFSLHYSIKKCFNSLDLENNFYNAELTQEQARKKIPAHRLDEATVSKYDAYVLLQELLGQPNLVETFCTKEPPRTHSVTGNYNKRQAKDP